jgi:hypothetical protein
VCVCDLVAPQEKSLLVSVRQEYFNLIDFGLVEQLWKMLALNPADASSETSQDSESTLREVLVRLGVEASSLAETEKKVSSMLFYTTKKKGTDINTSLRLAVDEHRYVIQELLQHGSITGSRPILRLFHALVVRRYTAYKVAKKAATASDVGASKVDAEEEEKLNTRADETIKAVSSKSTAQVYQALIFHAGRLESVRMQCTLRA